MSSLQDFLASRQAARRAQEERSAPAVIRDLKVARAAEPPPGSPAPSLKSFLFRRIEAQNPVPYGEIKRIVAMPFVDGFPAEEREAAQRRFVLAEHYERGFRLHDLQVDAVLSFERFGGLFAPIGVGWGKTLITLIIAGIAFRQGLRRILLFVPPQVLSQLTLRDIPWARQRVVLHGVPFHAVSGSMTRRRLVARSGKPGCYILPYSMLSTKDASNLLEWIQPQVIIADEAHYLKSHDAARTRRVLKYIDQQKPKVVALSGTITSKSVMDYHHLVLPLGEFCPLPHKRNLAVEWASVLDSGAQWSDASAGPLRPLLDWAAKQPGAPDCPYNGTGFRRAYRFRLATSPCVVGSSDQELGTSLTLQNHVIPHETCQQTGGWEELQRLVKDIELAWLTPDGDEIEHAIHTFKWLYELSAGFYNSLVWPEAQDIARRRQISDREADALLAAAKAHHAAKQDYARCLRKWLQAHHIIGLDTPMLVGADMARNGPKNVKDEELYHYWREMKALEIPGLPERDSRVIRVCPFKIDFAKRWAKEKKHGVIWYYHNGIGQWLKEEIPDALYCPAGKTHDREIAESEGRIVIASIAAHGTGKNLQFHQNQLVLQWPRPATVAEQMLGRLHRFGQEADELFVDLLNQPEQDPSVPSFDELVFAACLNDALYIQQTVGNRQKLIYCQYDPLPRIVPSAVLAERGLEPRLLSKDQERQLKDIFQVA